MCYADGGVLTYRWMDTQAHPFVDSNLERKCRDFGQLLRWKEERKVDMVKYQEMEKPFDAIQVKAQDAYYDMFGFGNSTL